MKKQATILRSVACFSLFDVVLRLQGSKKANLHDKRRQISLFYIYDFYSRFLTTSLSFRKKYEGTHFISCFFKQRIFVFCENICYYKESRFLYDRR